MAIVLLTHLTPVEFDEELLTRRKLRFVVYFEVLNAIVAENSFSAEHAEAFLAWEILLEAAEI